MKKVLFFAMMIILTYPAAANAQDNADNIGTAGGEPSGAANDVNSPKSCLGNGTYAGIFPAISVGMPGVVNFDFFYCPVDAPAYVPGFMFTFSLPTLLYNGTEASAGESEEDNDLFVAIELGAPFYLARSNSGFAFFALTPLAGFAKYKEHSDTGKDESGWWLYTGITADVKIWYIFAEAGVVYGPSRNFLNFELRNNVSLMWKIGAMSSF